MLNSCGRPFHPCDFVVKVQHFPTTILGAFSIFLLLFSFFFPRRAFHRKEEVCDKTIENDVVKVSQRQLTYGAKNFLRTSTFLLGNADNVETNG